MRILMISRGVPSKNDPQHGSFEFDQAKALAAMGHEVVIASVDMRFRLIYRKIGLSVKQINNNITAYNLFIAPSAIIKLFGNRIHERYIQWQWEKIKAAIITNEAPFDVIYSHYLFNSYYAVKYFSSLSIPIVALEHWSALNHNPIAPYVKAMAEFTYPRLSQLLTVSEPLKQRIFDIFNVPAKVVHNMVGNEFIYTNSPAEKLFTFISVGSLFPVKNHALLISALAKLNLPKDKWQLIIVGEGNERAHLQQLISHYNLMANIHLVGKKSKDEIVHMLNTSHVFVLPSLSENFSVAVLESLACGLPVIASICGGIRECINDMNGLLFEVGDENGLANCLNHMFTNYKNYDRLAIANDCHERFSSEVIALQLTKIFKEVASK